MENVDTAPRVSILCPILNVEPYIGQVIESAQAQTYRQWELIIMDGLSGDGTMDVVRRYAKDDSRIRPYSEKDENSWHALVKMLDLARGEFITLVCGQDGFLDPLWLERAMGILESDLEVSLVWGLSRSMSEDGVLSSEVHPSYSQFVESQGAAEGAKNVVQKFFAVGRDLVFGSAARRRALLEKLFSPNAAFRLRLMSQRSFPQGQPPQKRDWTPYWLDTALVFPDQSMIVSKRIFIECVPAYEPGTKTLGYTLEFYFEFNKRGYLPYFLPMFATFGRQHGGNSSERGAMEIHRQFMNYLGWVRDFKSRVERGNERLVFRDRAGRVIGEYRR
jgi:glycosyltransferase involved in cell wall biosynthesis